MSPPVSQLEAHLGHWLRLASNQAAQHLARALAAHGVTPAEWAMLRALHDSGPVAPSALALRAGLTRGAVTKLIDRLRAKALVVRAKGRGDRRFQMVALTGSGAKLVPVLAEIADMTDAAMFTALSPEQRATLISMLRGLVASSPDDRLAGGPVLR